MAAVTFLALLVTAAVRAAPGVLMVPLEQEFGWSTAAISLAIALNIALFGLIGPFAASLMDRWGLRRIVLSASALLTVAVGLTTQMRTQWQFTLLWGVCVGAATGVTAMVLAVVVANRWFDKRREAARRGAGFSFGGECNGTAIVSARSGTVHHKARLAKCGLDCHGCCRHGVSDSANSAAR